MNFTGMTSNGDRFEVYTEFNEIVYLDEYGDSLTWEDTEKNRQLVMEMVMFIVTDVKKAA